MRNVTRKSSRIRGYSAPRMFVDAGLPSGGFESWRAAKSRPTSHKAFIAGSPFGSALCDGVGEGSGQRTDALRSFKAFDRRGEDDRGRAVAAFHQLDAGDGFLLPRDDRQVADL